MRSHIRQFSVAAVAAFAVLAGCDRVVPPGGTESSTPEPAAAAQTVYNGLTMDQLKALLTGHGAQITEVQPGFLRIEGGPIVMLTQCEQAICYEISIGRS